MFKQIITDYFTFSKKERSAILALIAIILIIAVVPVLIPAKKFPQMDAKELASIGEKLQRHPDSFGTREKSFSSGADWRYGGTRSENHAFSEKARLFHFDPNLIGEKEWMQLGVRERTAKTILKFRDKGGRFRQPEDLGKIYGLSESDKVRLLPFVQIGKRPTENDTSQHNQRADRSDGTVGTVSRLKQSERPIAAIKINAADSSEWEQLPGIGAKLAARIINFRARLGGFYAVSQVAETFGLQDSAFQRIKPFLQLDEAAVRMIRLNVAGIDELRMHPYIRWAIAKAIVGYRDQHGAFKGLEDLRNVSVLSPELLERLAPYLSFS